MFALLAVVGGGIATASAAANSTTGKSVFRQFAKKTLTDEQKAEMDAKIKNAQSEMAARQAAIDTAVAANDYNAWVKAVGEKSPLVSKINAANFSKYVQAENLMKQARDIYKELGINQGEGFKNGNGRVSPSGVPGKFCGHGLEKGAESGAGAACANVGK